MLYLWQHVKATLLFNYSKFMLTDKQQLGNKGEQLAAKYLENKGYKLIFPDCLAWLFETESFALR